jgi:integrase
VPTPTDRLGTLRPLANGWEARIVVDDAGTKKGFVLEPFARKDEDAARERKNAMAVIARRLRRSKHAHRVLELLAMAAKQPPKSWGAILVAVDKLCAEGGAARLATQGGVPTFGAFARDWCSGALHARFPADIPKIKTSDKVLQALRKWAFPVLEHLPIDTVTRGHARDVLARMPTTMAPRSRKKIAVLINRVMNLAAEPCDYIEHNPLPKGFGGRAGKRKAMTYLYPSEDRQLLGCDAVPFVHRMFYGLLAREGLRASEALGLSWRSLDLERGSIRLDTNKTEDPRSWALDPGVLRALRWWRERRSDEESTASLFGELEQPYWLAIRFRRSLAIAGVTRAELTERSDFRQQIRLHDLRSTFVTLALANGANETFIMDRTGHRSSTMINRYRRVARTHAELGQGVLTPLDEALGLPIEPGAQPVAESHGEPPAGAARPSPRDHTSPSIGARADHERTMPLSTGRDSSRAAHDFPLGVSGAGIPAPGFPVRIPLGTPKKALFGESRAAGSATRWSGR